MSLTVREIQMKTIVRYLYKFTRRTKFKSLIIPSVTKYIKQVELIYIHSDGNVNCAAHLGKV
jgi:hypothetical protein